MDNASSQIRKVAIIGAGTMGIGIAAASVMAGYTVMVKDVNDELLAQARTELTSIVGDGVTRGMVAEPSAREVLDTHPFTIHNDAIAEADLVIEAVPERFELKQALFAEIDASAHSTTVLATNTSSLSVNALASVTNRPDRFVGMRFFNPPIS
jgi:3-hydroxyacyl-CoA dehydrogenase